MRASSRTLLFLAPAIGALAGCSWLGIGGSEQASVPPPTAPAAPPATVTGALVAPVPLPTPPQSASAPVYSGSSGEPSFATGADLKLSANEVLALLANNTAIGLTGSGVPYMVYFANDGSAHFREETVRDTGTWRVLPDGQVCSALPSISRGSETCYALARAGDVIIYQRPDGVAIGSIRVVAGNPQNL